MRKYIWLISSYIFLLVGFSSCSNKVDDSQNAIQSFSQDNLKISINSVQWEDLDKAKSSVTITPMTEDRLMVNLQSILQDNPDLSLQCINNNSIGFEKYHFEGELETADYEIEVYGLVNNDCLDLRVDYEAKYDITRKWMIAATSGADLGLDFEVPDCRLEMRLPEGGYIDNEPIPSDAEVQEMVYDLNSMMVMLAAYVNAMDFTEEGYFNLSLIDLGQEMAGMQNAEMGNLLQYYTDNRSCLTLYARTSLVTDFIENMCKSTAAEPNETPFPEFKLRYELNGQKLRIYLDKDTLLAYMAILWNILNDLDAEDLQLLSEFTGEDLHHLLGQFRYIQSILEEFADLFSHEDAHFLLEVNLIPWTPGERPWSHLL